MRLRYSISWVNNSQICPNCYVHYIGSNPQRHLTHSRAPSNYYFYYPHYEPAEETFNVIGWAAEVPQKFLPAHYSQRNTVQKGRWLTRDFGPVRCLVCAFLCRRCEPPVWLVHAVSSYIKSLVSIMDASAANPTKKGIDRGSASSRLDGLTRPRNWRTDPTTSSQTGAG